ncbi:hypothetical protein [Jiangella asiatica]|uniref:Uncharacterized protein n=1 Tax=Jiangella asiatica TaxID=2530372 RepID=A0A4R5D849_9ACTN|nr:hypothetical protein [Jiangella asiatica]TDE09719.1 hypothetical protein E1269_13955 [Jiangella asiatica]
MSGGTGDATLVALMTFGGAPRAAAGRAGWEPLGDRVGRRVYVGQLRLLIGARLGGRVDVVRSATWRSESSTMVWSVMSIRPGRPANSVAACDGGLSGGDLDEVL